MQYRQTREADEFYVTSLKLLNQCGIPYLVAGTFAVNAYIGTSRKTKDLDIFCKAGDYPKILDYFRSKGYEVVVSDERWLAKVVKGEYFFDLIFNMANALAPVRDGWSEHAVMKKIYGVEARVLPPTELVLSKMFIQDRNKYEGSDVAHLFLFQHDKIDWKKLLSYLDQYWEVLLMHVLNFRFIYPSLRECVPSWLFRDLLERLKQQIHTPTSQLKVCRGRIFSRLDYAVDIHDWGFADLIGAQNEYERYLKTQHTSELNIKSDSVKKKHGRKKSEKNGK